MKKSTILSLAICTLMVGLMTSTAHAAVNMFLVFSDPTTGAPESLQANSVDILSFSFGASNTEALTSSQLASCTDCATTPGPVIFLSSLTPVPGQGADVVQVLTASNSVQTFVFGPTAFTSAGVFADQTGKATLAVPEPSAAGFSIAGGILLAGLAFFRRKSATGNLLA
jgi:hypothetical protein